MESLDDDCDESRAVLALLNDDGELGELPLDALLADESDEVLEDEA